MPYQCDANVIVPSDCSHSSRQRRGGSGHDLSSSKRASDQLDSKGKHHSMQQSARRSLSNRKPAWLADEGCALTPFVAKLDEALSGPIGTHASRFSVGKLRHAEQTQPPRPAVSDLSQLSGAAARFLGAALWLLGLLMLRVRREATWSPTGFPRRGGKLRVEKRRRALRGSSHAGALPSGPDQDHEAGTQHRSKDGRARRAVRSTRRRLAVLANQTNRYDARRLQPCGCGADADPGLSFHTACLYKVWKRLSPPTEPVD